MFEIIISCLLTIVIEFIVLLILKAERNILFLSIIINIITNASLNILLYFIKFPKYYVYVITVIILEILIVFIEAIYYYIFLKDFKKSFKYSIITNVSSYLFGLIISLIYMLLS